MQKFSRSPISPARSVAFDVLLAVEGGSYASDDLRSRSVTLSGRDAGLASQIVFGCLRFQSQLDYLIGLYSGRKLADLDPEVRIALRAAIFQMRYLERVPATRGGSRLRGICQEAPACGHRFGKCRAPQGESRPCAMARPRRPSVVSGMAVAPLAVFVWRRNGAKSLPKSHCWNRSTTFEFPTAPSGPRILSWPKPQLRDAIDCNGAGPENLRFHDIGSQSIVPHLDLQPGQSFLDVCAAPGNKLAQALEIHPGRVVACDVSPERIRSVAAKCDLVVLDATEPLPFAMKFDRILVDAPCTGTGTLAGNPEIKWRLRPADFGRFHEKQAAILTNALNVLAPRGKLVYATCSLEHEENQDVVKEVLAKFPFLHCEKEVYRIPGRDEGDGFYAAVIS